MSIFSDLLLGLANPKKLYLKKDYYRLAELLNSESKREEAAKLLIDAGTNASQALLKSFNDTFNNLTAAVHINDKVKIPRCVNDLTFRIRIISKNPDRLYYPLLIKCLCDGAVGLMPSKEILDFKQILDDEESNKLNDMNYWPSPEEALQTPSEKLNKYLFCHTRACRRMLIEILEILKEIGEEGIRQLEGLLDDNRPPVRLIAAGMLNAIGTQTAKEIIGKNTHKIPASAEWSIGDLM